MPDVMYDRATLQTMMSAGNRSLARTAVKGFQSAQNVTLRAWCVAPSCATSPLCRRAPGRTAARRAVGKTCNFDTYLIPPQRCQTRPRAIAALLPVPSPRLPRSWLYDKNAELVSRGPGDSEPYSGRLRATCSRLPL
jgi:hypothetical protein